MHKIFAKPSILGKKVIFLPECHSTNDLLIKKARESGEKEGLVIYSDYQTKGRGQRGNAWVAERGRNILMSILLKPAFLQPSLQYVLNLVAAMGVLGTLKSFLPEKEIKVKWPNDVYLNDKKIAGILVEGNIKGRQIDFAVVGIGLNLNQKGFGLTNATSVYLESGKEFDKEAFIEELVTQIENWYLDLVKNGLDNLKENYLNNLLWKGEMKTFQDNSGLFEGCIEGIDNSGKLVINTENQLRYYDVKEVRFIG